MPADPTPAPLDREEIARAILDGLVSREASPPTLLSRVAALAAADAVLRLPAVARVVAAEGALAAKDAALALFANPDRWGREQDAWVWRGLGSPAARASSALGLTTATYADRLAAAEERATKAEAERDAFLARIPYAPGVPLTVEAALERIDALKRESDLLDEYRTVEHDEDGDPLGAEALKGLIAGLRVERVEVARRATAERAIWSDLYAALTAGAAGTSYSLADLRRVVERAPAPGALAEMEARAVAAEARATKAEAERDHARALAVERRDALVRLHGLYCADLDMGDPPVPMPEWLASALYSEDGRAFFEERCAVEARAEAAEERAEAAEERAAKAEAERDEAQAQVAALLAAKTEEERRRKNVEHDLTGLVACLGDWRRSLAERGIAVPSPTGVPRLDAVHVLNAACLAAQGREYVSYEEDRARRAAKARVRDLEAEAALRTQERYWWSDRARESGRLMTRALAEMEARAAKAEAEVAEERNRYTICAGCGGHIVSACWTTRCADCSTEVERAEARVRDLEAGLRAAYPVLVYVRTDEERERAAKTIARLLAPAAPSGEGAARALLPEVRP